ncbi:28S ribosomal protein S35, mitochondrial [Thelohanellus kitauei]|uniref:28S ribosomal protein S35, mitochondrial n=1 Tax=Thelohanellus kitauei TaxID=669202 RepID=A0A0C2J118_THEKT|nr:28S ribosomal protein S35, mitochondrial [Thelohanellus kitauei]
MEAVLCKNQTFSPEMIPLSVSTGRNKDNLNNTFKTPSPGPSGNIETLKIPTFFHLTPDVIKKHCKELKELCTPWPEQIKHLDTKITYFTYIYSGSNFTQDGSQNVEVVIPFSKYKGTEEQVMKMMLLLGKKYEHHTGSIVIKADKFKSREQNIEYAFEALRNCVFESKIVRDFETLSKEQNNIKDIPFETLFNWSHSPKWKRKNIKTIVNGKLVRFNRVGHPFLVEIPKLGIVGPYNDPKVTIAPLTEEIVNSKTTTTSIVSKRLKIHS